MPPAVPWYVTFAQLFYAAPVLIVSVVGLMLSIRHVSRNPVRARYAAAGFGLIFIARLVTTILLELMSQFVDRLEWGPLEFQKVAVLISTTNSLLMAVGIGLLGMALFTKSADREPVDTL